MASPLLPAVARRPLAALAAVTALAAVAVAAPQASALTSDATACGQEFSQVFAPWNDRDYYTLAQGGDFEQADAGWRYSGDAAVVADDVDNSGTGADRHSLRLGAGGTAVTPPVCVTDAHRTMRFFARDLADRSGNSALRVEMIYTNANGNLQVKAIDNLTPSTAWAPTKVLRLDTSKYYGELATAEVRFRFTAGKGSSVLIDDVFVDPRLR